MRSRLRPELIDGRARDGFDKQSWIEEADRHLRSAKILRDSRKRRRAALSKKPRPRIDNILAMDAAVHSSVLLVSYAIELFLKAGLTRVYVGCSKKLFERDVKRYGHNLVKLAREIEYPLPDATKKHLRELQSVILSEGRYPFLSENSELQRDRVNQRAHRFWSDERFEDLRRLAGAIRTHALMLDGDSKNSAWYSNAAIDCDGHFAFRCGAGSIQKRRAVVARLGRRVLAPLPSRAMLDGCISCPTSRSNGRPSAAADRQIVG